MNACFSLAHVLLCLTGKDHEGLASCSFTLASYLCASLTSILQHFELQLFNRCDQWPLAIVICRWPTQAWVQDPALQRVQDPVQLLGQAQIQQRVQDPRMRVEL